MRFWDQRVSVDILLGGIVSSYSCHLLLLLRRVCLPCHQHHAAASSLALHPLFLHAYSRANMVVKLDPCLLLPMEWSSLAPWCCSSAYANLIWQGMLRLPTWQISKHGDLNEIFHSQLHSQKLAYCTAEWVICTQESYVLLATISSFRVCRKSYSFVCKLCLQKYGTTTCFMSNST